MGTQDAANEVKFFNNDWENAWIVPPDPAYDVIPGTKYIGFRPDSSGPDFAAILYRAFFTLPVGWSGAFVTVCLHADNAARVFLNGNPFGEQTFGEIFENFQDPAECFSEDRQELFKTGSNELRFKVYNFVSPIALDYEATVTFTP